MDIQILAAIFLFALVMVVTPGPNNIMLMASGLNYGARRTIPHAFGIILGVPVMTLAVGFGLGQLFIAVPFLHQFIKVAGITYLLYLAWQVASTKAPASEDYAGDVSQPFTFFQALLFQWVNPKAWVMVVGAISAYTSNNFNVEILIIALCFFCAAFFSTSLWTFCGSLLSRGLRSAHHRVLFNRTMGVLLVLSILPMIESAL
ncbi:MAG: threonine/homoserine/homoserine lactone efflux protein [Cellvibrionaceae bacterium]